MTLEEVFQTKELEVIQDFSKSMLEIHNADQLSKDELVPLMLNAAQEQAAAKNNGFLEWLLPFIPAWEDSIYEMFEEMIQKGSVALAHRIDAEYIESFKNFPFYGIKPGKRYDRVFLASEIIESVKSQKDFVEQLRYLGDDIEFYAASATVLYGIVTFKEIVDLFKRYRGQHLTEAVVETILTGRQFDEECGFFLVDSYVLHDEFTGEDCESLMQSFLQARKGKPRWYAETEEEFFSYVDDDAFFELPQTEALRDWLEKHHAKGVDDLIWTIYYHVQHQARMQESFDAITEAGVTISMEGNGLALARLIIDFSNHLRLRINNGYTPDELMRRMYPSHAFIADFASKIGRNDLCPCGSGKKYKKCCGRKI